MNLSSNQTLKDEKLKIGSLELSSRLFLGTAQYPSLETLKQSIQISETELVTLGIRRINLDSSQKHSMIDSLNQLQINYLPNTAGCFTAKEAVLTAELSREALNTNRIKLEVIGDDYSLYPDSVELLSAAKELVDSGFEVYPYCSDDIVICQKLQDIGCVCVMPLASPIGTGQGIQNPKRISLIRKKINIPVIIDAGIGCASDASLAMELGVDGVLINTAVAKSGFPIKMAEAFKYAVKSGRLSYLAQRIPEKDYAESSTNPDGKIQYKMKI